jgi:hypothetical protein
MGQLHEKQLLEVIADLCRFGMHEVIHPMGIFFSKDHELATDPKCISVCEWVNHSTLPPQVALETRKRICIQAILLMMYCNDICICIFYFYMI